MCSSVLSNHMNSCFTYFHPSYTRNIITRLITFHKNLNFSNVFKIFNHLWITLVLAWNLKWMRKTLLPNTVNMICVCFLFITHHQVKKFSSSPFLLPFPYITYRRMVSILKYSIYFDHLYLWIIYILQCWKQMVLNTLYLS